MRTGGALAVLHNVPAIPHHRPCQELAAWQQPEVHATPFAILYAI